MKQNYLPFLILVFTLSSCEKKPFYADYEFNLTSDIEKEWHLDSVSVRQNRENVAASEPCISDDIYIFRYDNTLTYFNSETEWMMTPGGMECGSKTIFEIREWEIINDTILKIENTRYNIESLTEYEMVLRKPSEILVNEGSEKLYDYDFYYPREREPSL